MILHRRSQLLKWLEGNAPTASIRRAVGEGSVEHLGCFMKIPGSKFPGHIIRVTSTITGIIWYVVIRSATFGNYYAWVLDRDIPWQFWNTVNSNSPYLQGDQPETYRENREDAQAQRRSEIYQEDISP